MNPSKSGRYLACVYEWVGDIKSKPNKPEWVIKYYVIETRLVRDDPACPIGLPRPAPRTEAVKEYWEKQQYRFDTGGMENLEVIDWKELPPIP